MRYTAELSSLLVRIKRERNGFVADTMKYYGEPYALNYGVSIPTIRLIAQELKQDQQFAEFLIDQEIREFQIVAMCMADASQMSVEQITRWGERIHNSEQAEMMACELLQEFSDLETIYEQWMQGPNPMLCYSAMLAASRSVGGLHEWMLPPLVAALQAQPLSRVVAVGATRLLPVLARKGGYRTEVSQLLADLPSTDNHGWIVEEVSWQLDF